MKKGDHLKKVLQEIAVDLGVKDIEVHLDAPQNPEHGEYATNLALILGKSLGKSPRAVAEDIQQKLLEKKIEGVSGVEVAGPGFVNIRLSQEFLISELGRVLSTDEAVKSSYLNNKRIMVEYAHPNTHKEMHIGHMRTLITGEALARVLQAAGAKLFRANYQGDIGPHVAKALYGVRKIMEREGIDLDQIKSWSNIEKANFLGRGYALGSQEYEENKGAIDNINMQLYTKSPEIEELYQITREWSLQYYDEFYSRFYTMFDRLFFESEMVEPGRKIVEEHIGDVFSRENDAVIFPGEKYGLHTRVFITRAGNPTYEGKEMGNAFAEHEAFPFDMKIHVVGSEQAGYFQVVFKALELIDPDKFEGKQHHVSMGMVDLVGRKMSSRTGEILRVDWLLDQVKGKVEELLSEGRIEAEKKDQLVEQIVIGAVKYSILKVGPTQGVAFDIGKSVSLEGDSGPYLQYTYARTQSVLRKAEISSIQHPISNIQLEEEELMLLRLLVRFEDVVVEAAMRYAPNVIATYLYSLASSYNNFYQKHQILKAEGETREFRLALTSGVGKTLKNGLNLLGIQAPEVM